ncbi:acyl-CoA thioesterase [Aureimonas sp. SK2]|uniref:acyl-CoA thioesterase n=1 Tax=Aureimonas sp. SK2 TaxID=3015992 RepID=UPI002443903E|nr:acyl-CoA thioesterase [Aureimonas sp. SK2]
MSDSASQPTGDLIIRVQAMPADSNAAGDIFGGWVMSQMDLAAGVRGAERAGGRVVTAAVQSLAFRKPVKIGDTLCVYARIEKVGNTSITLHVEAWARRYLSDHRELVTEGSFVMVALDEAGQPTPVPPHPA